MPEEYRAWYLIDILRARTFPPYEGAYFTSNGRKVFMRLELTLEEASHSGDANDSSTPRVS